MIRLLRALATFAVVLGCTAVSAADWPARPVRIVLPFAAGGGGDQLTRALAQKLSEAWGQPVVVENRPGAGATLGTDAVAKAPADGYTLLLAAGTITLGPAAYPKLPYDTVRDFAPITMVAHSPYVLVVNPAVKASSFDELLRLARAEPGRLNFASGGNGTLAHLCVELLKQRAGVSVVHVPYKGSAPALNDVVGGQVQAMFDTPAAVRAFVESQRLRAIAVSSSRRSTLLPALPTIAESGVPGYDVSVWFGVLAPAGTPREVLDRVRADTHRAIASPELQERMRALGMEPLTTAGDAFGALIRDEIAGWGALVKAAGIRFE
jgi:tripartite-type tricarboxylate transporter receptor subunit TctC